VRDWEHRLEEGLKLWRHLQEKAKPLENWISAAEHALNTSSADNSLVELSVCAIFCFLFNFCCCCKIMKLQQFYNKAPFTLESYFEILF